MTAGIQITWGKGPSELKKDSGSFDPLPHNIVSPGSLPVL